MKRRDAIKSLAVACGINIADIKLDELNPNGVYILSVPEEYCDNVFFVEEVKKAWNYLWRNEPNKPRCLVLSNKAKLINLKDSL